MQERKITDELLMQFEVSLYHDEKSNVTVEKYMHDVRYFRTFADGKDIDKELLLDYKLHLEHRYAISSANSMLAALNSFLRFAGWYDCCVKQFRLQKKVYCSEEKELTKAEYMALIQTAHSRHNERLELLIQTICATGIRVSEVKYITMEALQKGEAIVSCKGKTRVVFLVAELRKKLLKYTKRHGIKSGMVFVTKNGTALNRSNIWSEMKALCQQAKVSPCKVFPHNLRHLFARTFYRVEKDIAKLADILGHSNINTTRIYIISTGEEHRRKMERLQLII